MKRKGAERRSALLLSWGMIAGCFAAALLGWWIGLGEAAALLLAAGVLGLVGRLWGSASLRRVELRVEAESTALSVGQSLRLRYELKNNKVLPLIWLELCQEAPMRGCLRPTEGFSLVSPTAEETAPLWIRQFSFFSPYAARRWDTEWTAECRGVYRPGPFGLRSGDGFGLTRSRVDLDVLKDRVFVVWPRIIPVDTGPFLRYVWTGAASRTGYAEDPTVTRGIRAYQPGDPWKRIDWRTAARTDELMVRQYDTILPQSILFVLDLRSLEDRERAISLLASLILALEKQGIACGLALPGTAAARPMVIAPEAGGSRRCLFALAEVEAESASAAFDESALSAAAASAGQVWMLAQSAAELSCPAVWQRLRARAPGLIGVVRRPGLSFGRELSLTELLGKGASA